MKPIEKVLQPYEYGLSASDLLNKLIEEGYSKTDAQREMIGGLDNGLLALCEHLHICLNDYYEKRNGCRFEPIG